MKEPLFSTRSFVIVVAAIWTAVLLAPLGLACQVIGGVGMADVLNKIVGH
jgi:hypothetical protein